MAFIIFDSCLDDIPILSANNSCGGGLGLPLMSFVSTSKPSSRRSVSVKKSGSVVMSGEFNMAIGSALVIGDGVNLDGFA